MTNKQKFWTTVFALIFLAGLITGGYLVRRFWPKKIIVYEPASTQQSIKKIIAKPPEFDPILGIKFPEPPEIQIKYPSPKERIYIVKTVPIEVTKKFEITRWPQTIHVHISSVQALDEKWYQPINPHLILIMIRPGMYTAPPQRGWNIRDIETVTHVRTERQDRLRLLLGMGIQPVRTETQTWLTNYYFAGIRAMLSGPHLFLESRLQYVNSPLYYRPYLTLSGEIHLEFKLWK